MTDTIHSTGTRRPAIRRGGAVRRLGRAIGYDVRLVPVGVRTMADAVLGQPERAAERWRRLATTLEPARRTAQEETQAPQRARSWVFVLGLLSTVLGLLSWFLVGLAVTAVVRGPFWGFVQHGPVGPGTWGGPSRAGAWAVHAALAVPSILAFLLALKGIAALQARSVRPLYGEPAGRWVLPATIIVVAGGLLFFWSWLQQL